MKILKISLFVSLTCFTLTIFAQREINYTKPDSPIQEKRLHLLRPTSYKNSEIFTVNFLRSLPSIKIQALNKDSIDKYVASMQPHAPIPKDNDTQRIEYQYPEGFFYEGPRTEKLIDLKSNAQYYNENIQNGKLWILKINSDWPGMRFIYSSFFLPEGSTLHMYTLNNKYSEGYWGPFTSVNNPKDPSRRYVFTTSMVKDNVVYLEYFELNDAPIKGKIVISSIIQAY